MFSNIATEVDLSKILNNQIFKGIRVDFYIKEYNTIIEVDGIQHFQPSFASDNKIESLLNYTKQISRDSKLKEICKAKNINIVNISYQMSYNDILKTLLTIKDAHAI